MGEIMRIILIAGVSLLAALPLSAVTADPPKRNCEVVELTGKATDYWFNRNWSSYYWREDFTFLLAEDGGNRTWRIISREPTPAYTFRMGTTFTNLKVDWQAKPRVKVLAVKAVDRIPADFYDFKLNEPNLATALIVWVETRPNEWKEFYVNNWIHPWGEKADKKVHGYYADKKAPYDIYGFARGQSAPFDKKAQAILDKNKDNPSLMFHGLVKTAKDGPFGYEIELIDLIGRDVKTGGHVILHGDARTIPLLDGKKPEK
jgi:hypothetical protein